MTRLSLELRALVSSLLKNNCFCIVGSQGNGIQYMTGGLYMLPIGFGKKFPELKLCIWLFHMEKTLIHLYYRKQQSSR